MELWNETPGIFEMLGDGGKLYWVRNPTRMKTEGIVVVFGWVSVTEEQLSGLVDLYGDLRWDSLVCAADFFDAWVFDFKRFIRIYVDII